MKAEKVNSPVLRELDGELFFLFPAETLSRFMSIAARLGFDQAIVSCGRGYRRSVESFTFEQRVKGGHELVTLQGYLNTNNTPVAFCTATGLTVNEIVPMDLWETWELLRTNTKTAAGTDRRDLRRVLASYPKQKPVTTSNARVLIREPASADCERDLTQDPPGATRASQVKPSHPMKAKTATRKLTVHDAAGDPFFLIPAEHMTRFVSLAARLGLKRALVAIGWGYRYSKYSYAFQERVNGRWEVVSLQGYLDLSLPYYDRYAKFCTKTVRKVDAIVPRCVFAVWHEIDEEIRNGSDRYRSSSHPMRPRRMRSPLEAPTTANRRVLIADQTLRIPSLDS